jgi:hypothetical protein
MTSLEDRWRDVAPKLQNARPGQGLATTRELPWLTLDRRGVWHGCGTSAISAAEALGLAEAEDGRECFVDAPLLFRAYPAD